MVLVLLRISLESGARFFNQSQRELKHNQSKTRITFDTQLTKRLSLPVLTSTYVSFPIFLNSRFCPKRSLHNFNGDLFSTLSGSKPEPLVEPPRKNFFLRRPGVFRAVRALRLSWKFYWGNQRRHLVAIVMPL